MYGLNNSLNILIPTWNKTTRKPLSSYISSEIIGDLSDKLDKLDNSPWVNVPKSLKADFCNKMFVRFVEQMPDFRLSVKTFPYAYAQSKMV